MNVEILNKLGEMMDNILGILVLSGIMIIVFGIVFVFGLTNCILGYRLLRFWMMIFGFCIGAGIGFFLVYRIDTEEKAYYMAAMLGIGVVMAVLAFMIYRAGIFILGAGLGLFLSIYLIHPTSSFSFFLCILIHSQKLCKRQACSYTSKKTGSHNNHFPVITQCQHTNPNSDQNTKKKGKRTGGMDQINT